MKNNGCDADGCKAVLSSIYGGRDGKIRNSTDRHGEKQKTVPGQLCQTVYCGITAVGSGMRLYKGGKRAERCHAHTTGNIDAYACAYGNTGADRYSDAFTDAYSDSDSYGTGCFCADRG